MKRKIPLVTGQVYHIFSRSIANYQIFNCHEDYLRMIRLLRYYQVETDCKFSHFIKYQYVLKNSFNSCLEEIKKDKKEIVQIIAYCIMPTHLHLILGQLNDKGITNYCGNVLNSYSKYFNTKHERKGPLWEGKFKNVIVDQDEQLLHLTRYIHLNPTTVQLVDQPEKWPYSSYKEYLELSDRSSVCKFKDLLDIESSFYRKFVNERIPYQQKLAKIKNLLLE